jgi:putative two-component system response regulator
MEPELILIVDDEEVLRRSVQLKLAREGYQCQTAANASQAQGILQSNTIALVLLDIKMPGKPGTELLPEIRASYPDTAVVMVTATDDARIAIQCMKEGAYDYIAKPFNLDEVVLSVGHALEKRRLQIENREYRQHLEEMVAKRTAELREAIGRIKLASLDTIHRLAQASEYKDEDTGAHIKRMSQYCAAIARKMGLGDGEVENILYAAPMHDVGKIGIADNILLKPGKLSQGEWEIMKQHTVIGAEILSGSDVGFIQLAEVIALTHHEKWDGSGYPRGLRGSKIPLTGRITAIADVFDALISDRPYKVAYSIEKSLEIIKEGRGNHFDPDAVDAFFGIKDEIVSIKHKYEDKNEEGSVAPGSKPKGQSLQRRLNIK